MRLPDAIEVGIGHLGVGPGVLGPVLVKHPGLRVRPAAVVGAARNGGSRHLRTLAVQPAVDIANLLLRQALLPRVGVAGDLLDVIQGSAQLVVGRHSDHLADEHVRRRGRPQRISMDACAQHAGCGTGHQTPAMACCSPQHDVLRSATETRASGGVPDS